MAGKIKSAVNKLAGKVADSAYAAQEKLTPSAIDKKYYIEQVNRASRPVGMKNEIGVPNMDRPTLGPGAAPRAPGLPHPTELMALKAATNNPPVGGVRRTLGKIAGGISDAAAKVYANTGQQRPGHESRTNLFDKAHGRVQP